MALCGLGCAGSNAVLSTIAGTEDNDTATAHVFLPARALRFNAIDKAINGQNVMLAEELSQLGSSTDEKACQTAAHRLATLSWSLDGVALAPPDFLRAAIGKESCTKLMSALLEAARRSAEMPSLGARTIGTLSCASRLLVMIFTVSISTNKLAVQAVHADEWLSTLAKMRKGLGKLRPPTPVVFRRLPNPI